MATTDKLRDYRPAGYPQINRDPSWYVSKEVDKIAETLGTILDALVLLDTTATSLKSAANDAAAATAGVPVGGLYHNSGAVRVRLT